MGTRTKGFLTQNFRINIDVENLAEYIADKIIKTISQDKSFDRVELGDYYFDGDELEITGSYVTKYEHWHCEPTLESPGEDEVVREYIGNHSWFLSELPDEIYDHISVNNVCEDDSMIEDDRYEL